MKKIIIATRNPDKLQEYQSMFEHLKFELFSLADFDMPDVEETADNFFDNAVLKAKAVRRVARECVLADDSGLEVNALNGLPGVKSKRFSEAGTDRANNEKLLKLMENEVERQARFVTTICLIEKNGDIKRFEGELHGYIHTACEGENGFGYDPLFIPVGYTKTLAELDSEIKNKMSHRARCFQQVVDHFESE